jgi:hypothetical protein
VAWIIGVTIVVDVLMIVTGMGPNVLLVAALGVLVGVGLWFVVDLSDVAVGSDTTATRQVRQPDLRAERRVMQLRSSLATGRPDRPALVNLRATLVELIDDQLRAGHDVDLATEPDRARAIMGDDLYGFVVDEDSAAMLASPRGTDQILTLIERL